MSSTGGGDRARAQWWRLAPWTRAPWLGLRSPAAVLAILVTTAVLACAAASAPLFLSSALSAALQQQLAPQCAEAAYPAIGASARLAPEVPAERLSAEADRYRNAWSALGHRSDRVLTVYTGIGPGGQPQRGVPVLGTGGGLLSQPATLFWRPGVTGHVHSVAGSAAAGVWLPRTYAQAAHATVGERITVAGAPVTVAGIYTDLFDTDYGAYWCHYEPLFLNPGSGNIAPPALVLATDQQTLFRLAAAARSLYVQQLVPVDGGRLSVSAAERLLAQEHRAQAAAQQDSSTYAQVNTDLPQAIAQAQLIDRGLRGPVIPVALAGALLALVLVATAGSFWVDRRAAEVRLLVARGVGPAPLGVKAALELALPALAGAAAGWAAARGLIAAVGPAPQLDPSATHAALLAGAAGFAVGLAAAATVAGLRARGSADHRQGAAPPWMSRAPWELIPLLAAVACWALLHYRPAIVVDHGVAQVNGLLVAFPVLGIAGAAVLLARAATTGLPGLRRWAAGRRPAVFLAVNRLTAARLAAASLLVAVTLPVAVFGYTATLTASSATTIDAKVGVELGARRVFITTALATPTAATAAAGTLVQRYDGSVPNPGSTHASSRRPVQVLAINPDTFADTAYWQPSFADQPLSALVERLTGPTVSGRLPIVAAGLPTGPADLHLGSKPVPAQVVATARLLPGRRLDAPLVLVAADRLPPIGPSAGSDRTSELWTNGPAGPAITALIGAGGRYPRPFTTADVFTVANFLGISWTFGYLSALAVFIGVIAAGGLLLYLEARSRARLPGYVMTRRLGLSRAAHLRSLLAEIGGVAATAVILGGLLATAAVAMVYRRLDVELNRPPTPLLTIPWTAVAIAVGVALAVIAAATLYAQHAADRANPATVLREDA